MTINWTETDLDSTAYRGFQPLIILSKLDAFTLVGIGSTPAEAATIFTDEAAFLSNVQASSYLETFDSLPPGNPLLSDPLSFSQNGFSYTATSANGLRRLGSDPDFWLSNAASFQPIAFNFTSGNVSAISGAFFPRSPVSEGGQVIPGDITLTLSDGTTQTLTNTNSTSFFGFIASPGTVFTSLTVASAQSSGNIFPTVNNLRVGTATTPIPTPALLPGLIGLGLGVWRKRKGELAEMTQGLDFPDAKD